MAKKIHHYSSIIEWTGNKGEGTKSYAGYDRSHIVKVNNKKSIECSSDPVFNGDPCKYNPEELLLASVSSCHMLWYLHLCSERNIIVIDYNDVAEGTMQEEKDGSGRFIKIKLSPVITITEFKMIEQALALHETAHKKFFIANSLNFPVMHFPRITVGKL